jgi:hypothetical protein
MSRAGYSVAAVVLSAAATLPVLVPQSAGAAQLSARFIKLSSSANGATDTVYSVGFTPTVTTAIKGIVVEFCSNSPIIGDACTALSGAGFNTNFASLVLANQTNISGFTVDTTNSTSSRVILLNGAGGAVATTPATVDLGTGTASSDGLTNPTTTNTTFYARIFTYNSTAGAQAYASATPGAHIDDGGIALSTAAQLTVTAKVQETLVFCVYTNANCAGGGTAVTLGDANGVLSNTATSYQSTAKFQLASNAQTGVNVRMKGDVLCRVAGSCVSSANTITSQGTTCTADSTTTTVEQFGFRIATAGTSVTAAVPYNCSAGNHTFDTANVNTTFGQSIATTAAPNDPTVDTTMEFSAKSATTTEAGIYTSTLTFIATGTY